ncbi:hypothetical protein CGT90_19270 [Vibrio metoecus]|nr:hypothetical protein CGT90_19270 [Vibrio metoecus]
MVVVIEFSFMRCQPLRRALVSLRKNHQKLTHKVLKNQLLAFNLHKLAFAYFLDTDLVERVESSVVSKSLKIIKPRCFNVV